MLNELANRLDPKAVTAIKVAAIAVGAITAAVVVGVVLNKMGVFEPEILDVTESAVNAAS